MTEMTFEIYEAYWAWWAEDLGMEPEATERCMTVWDRSWKDSENNPSVESHTTHWNQKKARIKEGRSKVEARRLELIEARKERERTDPDPFKGLIPGSLQYRVVQARREANYA